MSGRTIVGRGMMRHRFHGEYSAILVLAFLSVEDASEALSLLGLPWETCSEERRALRAVVDSVALERQKDLLASHGADRDKIASLRKSVDHGEPFEVRFSIPEEG